MPPKPYHRRALRRLIIFTAICAFIALKNHSQFMMAASSDTVPMLTNIACSIYFSMLSGVAFTPCFPS